MPDSEVYVTTAADRERVIEVLCALQAAIGRVEHHLTEHGYPLSNAPLVREDLQFAIEAVRRVPVQRACRVCGCTDDRACAGGCAWIAEDLCSACEDFEPWASP